MIAGRRFKVAKFQRGVVPREIPRPAGEDAGLRDDAPYRVGSLFLALLQQTLEIFAHEHLAAFEKSDQCLNCSHRISDERH